MNTSSDTWFVFIKTFSMLLFVLAVLVLVFYFIKKFSTAQGVTGSQDFIKILCVHHLSPKEKLVLLDVLDQTILIGVTQTSITKISSIEADIDFTDKSDTASLNFKDFLSQKLGKSFVNKEKTLLNKEERS